MLFISGEYILGVGRAVKEWSAVEVGLPQIRGWVAQSQAVSRMV